MQSFFLPTSLIEQAIEQFVDEIDRALRAYEATPARQRTPDERQAIAQLKRDRKAYEKVGDYWAAGIYPRAIDGLWEVGSLSERGTMHHIWREGNRWACDCRCAERGYFHVHQAMMSVIERGMELAEQYAPEVEPAPDAYELYEPEPDIDPEPFPTDAPRVLGQRLAAARASYVYQEAA